MVLIKKLLPSESDEFSQLVRLFTSESNARNDSYKTENHLESFLQNQKNHVVVASVNNTVIGGLTAYEIEMYKKETSEIFLFEIEVKEEYRQQGVGSLLIHKLKDICKQSSIQQIFVLTSRNNDSALKLYNSTGGVADNEFILFNYLL
jgi:aminoglycoside 3-N-acetyltransferase I